MLSKISSKLSEMGLTKTKEDEDLFGMLKTVKDKDLQAVNSGLRGAEVATKQGAEAPPADLKEAKDLDPVSDDEKEPSEKQKILYSALLTAIPTIIGSAVGGAEGGALGAKVGSDAVTKMETDKKERQKLAFERGLKKEELAEKKRGRDIDEKKLSLEERKIQQDKEYNEKKLASDADLKRLEKSLAGVKDKRDAAFQLQKTWDSNPSVVNYTKALEGISKIRNAGKENLDGAENQYNDTALIFNFMKVLDPTSVVREGEYKTAANNAGLLERLGISWEKVQSGQSLTPDQRSKIIEAAENQFNGHKTVYDSYSGNIKEIALRNGLDPRDIVVGFGGGSEKVEPKAVAKGAPKKGGIKEAQAAETVVVPKGKVRVQNAKTGEDLFIDADQLKAAELDGFKRVK